MTASTINGAQCISFALSGKSSLEGRRQATIKEWNIAGGALRLQRARQAQQRLAGDDAEAADKMARAVWELKDLSLLKRLAVKSPSNDKNPWRPRRDLNPCYRRERTARHRSLGVTEYQRLMNSGISDDYSLSFAHQVTGTDTEIWHLCDSRI